MPLESNNQRSVPAEGTVLPQWIGRRAQIHGPRVAVTYIDDGGRTSVWTYADLWRQACSVADRLPKVDQIAPRGLLLYPPGIDFLAGFLGCQIAGWTPVPTCYPKAGREMPRLDSAANDCQPAAIIGDRATIEAIDSERLCEAARSAVLVSSDADTASDDTLIDPEVLSIAPNSLALLQYTSGSTNEPKGVMVRHSNLMANLEAIRRGFGIDWQLDDPAAEADCGVFWLPFFHDMGLIGGILEPLYVGGQTVLMSPRAFLQRPIRWLQYISDHRAVVSGAPNFAYQLCVDRIVPEQTDGLDLSRWRIAFSGAEPVLPQTLQAFARRFSRCGFSSSAFYPCYGLAEATLLAAGGDGPHEPKVLVVERESLGAGDAVVVNGDRDRSAHKLICCGSAAHQTELVVVDPSTCVPVQDRKVGEIWIRGASIAGGYWGRDEEEDSRFNATLRTNESTNHRGEQGGYCRTGDIGFLHEGELYVTGRIKDVIILRGRNLFPQDIEVTVRETVGSEGGQCAAFAVEGSRGEALAIVAELPRRVDEESLPALVREIRRNVIEVHEVDPRHVLLVRQATVPLTSSGKVQRNRCRELFDNDEIKTKYRFDRASAGEPLPLPLPSLPEHAGESDRQSMTVMIEQWMSGWLVARAGVNPSEIALEKPFADYGLDSMTAVEMSGEIEDWSGIELTPVVAWNYPTVSRLSRFIVDQLTGENHHSNGLKPDPELEDLLDEIEQMSDKEISHVLAEKPQHEQARK